MQYDYISPAHPQRPMMAASQHHRCHDWMAKYGYSITYGSQFIDAVNCKPYLQQPIHLRFRIWKRWCRTTWVHFGMKVLQCLSYY